MKGLQSLSHSQVITCKVALLEGLLRDVMVNQFSFTNDPVGLAKRYAEKRVASETPGPHYEIYAAMMQEFLDGVVSELARRKAER